MADKHSLQLLCIQRAFIHRKRKRTKLFTADILCDISGMYSGACVEKVDYRS